MRKFNTIWIGLGLAIALNGCVARTIVGAATAPFRIASKAVDLSTTSQSESDEKRGRALRQREERLGRLDREYRKQSERCHDGNEDACARRDQAIAEIEALSTQAD